MRFLTAVLVAQRRPGRRVRWPRWWSGVSPSHPAAAPRRVDLRRLRLLPLDGLLNGLPLLGGDALRNDALGREITLGLSGRDDLRVFSEPNKLRSLVLGLLTLSIDASPAGAELRMELSCADGFAVLELRSQLTYDAIFEAQDLLGREPIHLKPQELVLGFARRWIMANGGRLEIPASDGTQAGLRLFYPLAADA